MKTKDFLLEIGCEELPPKLLKNYAEVLTANIINGLSAAGVGFSTTQAPKFLAAPRRLAVLILELSLEIPTKAVERVGPAVNAAYDKDGKATPALLGFAKSCNVDVKQLEKITVNSVEKFCYKTLLPAKSVSEVLPEIVNKAIKDLPIAKPMRWGNGSAEFIRPVHWVLMLLGSDVVVAEVLAHKTDRLTYGHRFLAPKAQKIASVADYEKVLTAAHVLVDFSARRKQIKHDVEQAAEKINGVAVIDEALLDEVTAILEWPAVLTANFDKKFLAVPQEALMSAMQQHQKSFPVVDSHGKILPHFIFVSNIESKQPQAVITGNEKVMRARLSDAMFFYETDLKIPLASHLENLKNVVFQAGLGDLYLRSIRIGNLAAFIAEQVEVEPVAAFRAGELSKCDLLTAMVGEFPELQGTMGYYYALKSGEDKAVALAIKEQYQPAFANDALPSSDVGACVALAEKIDTLVGVFGINQKPTGTKDPFGLRRAAIGVVRILVAQKMPLDLLELLKKSEQQYSNLANQNTITEVNEYIFDRLKAWYGEQGFPVNLFNAIAALNITHLVDFDTRLNALNKFLTNPACASLSAANKRVVNILNKENLAKSNAVDQSLLIEPAEKNLHTDIINKQAEIKPLLAKQDYAAVLNSLAGLQQSVDQFFDKVMVNADDPKVKNNRVALLWNLRALLNSAADLSRL
jgi:glycyl-tRNA synthetase beta chain